MKNYLILFVLFVIFSTSCKKDEITTTPTAIPTYLPLKIGNYWIYKNYVTDTLGNQTELGYLDSIRISGDSIINNQQFFVFSNYFVQPNQIGLRNYTIVRDSAGCLLNPEGELLFTPYDFSNVFREQILYFGASTDTLGIVYYRMKKIMDAVDVPAGSFEDVLCVERSVEIAPYYYNLPQHRTFVQEYAPETGIIYETWGFTSGTDIYDKRLLRYYVQ